MKTLLTLSLLAAVTLFGGDTSRKPNVIFFLADDLGYMDIGAYNPSTFYETPHIDRLAKQGMRFTYGYAACCVCSPTRSSIMTGKYPPRCGITDWIPGSKNARKLTTAPNANHLPLEEVTVAEAFREAGYATFIAGKWHLGGGNFSPNAQGFGPGLISSDGNQFWYPPSTVPPPDAKDDPKTTDRIANEAISSSLAIRMTLSSSICPSWRCTTRSARGMTSSRNTRKRRPPPPRMPRTRRENAR